MTPRQITVLTTNKCTARCNHCSMYSGPERRERLSLEQMQHAIAALRDECGIGQVTFAGGEPTLLGADLLDAISFASERGLMTRVVTNASWAVSEAAAYAKLRAMWEAGLDELNISTDDYHVDYVPIDRVENAWRAAKRIPFVSVIIANSHGPTSVVTPEYLKARLGENVQLVFNDDGWRRDLDRTTRGTALAIANSGLQCVGRGAEHLTQYDVLNSGENSIPCPNAVQKPALSPSNHLLACCGTYLKYNPVLDFGVMAEETLSATIERAAQDPHHWLHLEK